MQVSQADRATARQHHNHRWWKEVLFIVGFYVIYSFVRNQFGSARLGQSSEPTPAFDNALRVVRLERLLGAFHEQRVQRWFLPAHSFIQFWNVYYGTAHFVVTIFAFVAMFLYMPDRFARWRNTLAFTTALAIIGFSLFPLMPPRLLNNTTRFGGERIAQRRNIENFGFVDTLQNVGGLWSFDSGAVAKVSNQYAAMPSLHTAWATWCSLVLWPLTRRRWWAKALLVVYPLATLFCIVVTANHYWLDGLGGLVTLGAGYLAGRKFDLWNQRRLYRNRLASAPPSTGTR